MQVGELQSPAVEAAVARLSKTVQCPVCMDFLNSPVSLPCDHSYCQECIEEMMKGGLKHACPLCQKAFSKRSLVSISKSVDPVVKSIKEFIMYFEGKDVSEDKSNLDSELHVDKKFRMQRPDFKAGDLVHVAPRLWPGINKPGGTAWIQRVIEEASSHDNNDTNIFYDCKYVLSGGVDSHVPAAFIRVANDINEERESRSRRSKPRSAPVRISTPIKSNEKDRRSPMQQQAGHMFSKKGAMDSVLKNENSTFPIPGYDIGQPALALLCTTLSPEEINEVQKFCGKFSNVTLHDSYSSEISHVVVHAERKGKGKRQTLVLKNRTMKYLQGVLGHKWIVSQEWVLDSVRNNILMDETPYEVTRDSKANSYSFGPKWSRESILSSNSASAKGLFEVGCKYIFAGPFCHPGPTVDNLTYLIRTGGGLVMESTSAVVNILNASLDGGLKVQRKQNPMLNEVVVVVVNSTEAGNEFCQMVFLSISNIRTECAYDFGDFIDHLNGIVAVIHSDWIFDCISNYTFVDPLESSRFRVMVDRGDAWLTRSNHVVVSS